ncbi:hypothetical protein [Chitinophaga defluvii]|uniref:Uncharacterized protein n=1 Tax=Chitinophaga defluvii TaxID=3163343 RepID=A0ABV2TD25_9BACT
MKDVKISYPEWHNKPFRLTIDQLRNPQQVLEAFCCEYPLAEVRSALWEWFTAALSDEHANMQSIVALYENIDRLIEVIHILNSKNQ